MTLSMTTRYLFTRQGRRRYVAPHGLIEVLAALLHELVQMIDGIAGLTGDERWDETFDRLRDARDKLSGLNARQLELLARAREVALVEETLRELTRTKESLVRRFDLPRKPQARAVAHPAREVAPKRRRRR